MLLLPLPHPQHRSVVKDQVLNTDYDASDEYKGTNGQI